MQKSAAAAANAGVSYNELNTMLTVITSKTQLGGAQAGTALQTLFSRMNRVTKAGYINDEGGEATSINDVENALKSVGIQMREGSGFRSSTAILRDLAKVWNDINDLQRGNITYAMAGGRQQNMFQALMEGMAEDNGAYFDELLGVAEGSSGATQSKYEIIIEGINSKIQEMKSSFDGLIESFNVSGVSGGIIDMLSGIMQGLSGITEKAPAATVAIAGIAVAIKAVVTALTHSIPGVGAISAILGVVAGIGALGLGSAIG